MSQIRDDLVLAMTLLTRIPMPPLRHFDDAALGRSIWAYPVIGALVGAVGALVFHGLARVGVAALPAAVTAIMAMILTTGCFHEDGLADFWDGIGGGRTIERKLEIMRDSRIGSYGGAALILTITLRAALVAALATRGHAEIGLIVAGLVGRSAIAGVLLALPPARTEGLSAVAADPPRSRALIALAWCAVLFAVLPAQAALAALGAAVLATAWMIRLIDRQIRGYTGDALGASEQTVEMAALLALAAALSG